MAPSNGILGLEPPSGKGIVRIESGRGLPRHTIAAALFVGLSVVWTFPLVWHLHTSIPGAGTGDGPAFVWNNWLMRVALGSPDESFFWTHLQFAPFGTSLLLHTHTALPSFVSATMWGWLPIVPAGNLTLLAGLALNGFVAYLLAHDLTRSWAAGVLAGTIFATSPFVTGHLHGHFNLVHAWVLPLCLWCALHASRRNSARWAAAAGVAFVAGVYTDYYLAIYTAAALALLSALRLVRLGWTVAPPLGGQRARRLLLVGSALLGAGALAVQASGGGVFELAGWRISARRPDGLLTLAWLAALAYAVLTWAPRVRAGRTVHRLPASLVIGFAAPLTLLLPILVGAFELWTAGEYVSQQYRWRSSPRGIDVASLLLGNPWHPATGEWTRDAYARLGIDVFEGGGWIGVPLLLSIWWAPVWARTDRGRTLAGCGSAFFLWALGPWLTLGGVQTGILMPAMAVRWLPIVSNARMPGRAMVVVYLVIGLLVAVGWARRAAPLRPSRLAALLLLVSLDYATMPVPLGRVHVSEVYAQLPGTNGNLLELPLGVRDGFGEQGRMDSQVLLNQTVHGRPILGGFVARLSPRLRQHYTTDPLMRSLLSLSAGTGELPALDDRTALAAERDGAVRGLTAFDVRLVVVNRSTAPPRLLEYVERALPLTRVARGRDHDVYHVNRR